ncbi:hypothetical protein ACEWY4_013019 [Coilia grayii]|uniref:C2H2-type domain-containing protein n=1 Tax=Coilia grayii TaxID=363190 RepID=A0ABD1JV39_9TELE
METGKLGFVQTAVPEGSVAMTAAHETADRMHVQSPPPPPLAAAFYVRAMTGPPHQQQQPQQQPPSLPQQPAMTPQLQPVQTQLPAGIQDVPAIGLPIPTLCPKQPLPILTFHIAGGVPLTPTKSVVGGVTPAASKPPKSVGKHVCQYCRRDCLKPSVLEKHLRCHTGERPYPCNVCRISFKTQSNLYKHKRTQAHARSESDRASLSSQESLHSSRDTCFSSSLSLESNAQSNDGGSQDGNEVVFTPPLLTTTESGATQTHSNQGNTQGSGTAQALQQAALVGLIAAPMEVQKEALTPKIQQVEPPCAAGAAAALRDSKRTAGGGGPRPCSGALMALSRHLPLQRQEATLSPKPWDSMSMSRGKSQSHDSTDSGFSDSGEHHWSSSPGSSLHDHSMESLTESSMETPEHQPVCQMDSDSASAGESRSKVSVQEKRQLEERISKIILKNDALMDDKQLENVRPRKTVLSKQGSIDLPMPYTYKDSFHFEMRSTTTTSSKQSSGSPGPADRKGIQAFCTSMPSQHTGSPEHAPLTRSSSLPFSITGQLSDAASSSPHSPHCTNNLVLSRRSSMGHLYSLKLGAQSVDQHGPGHRSLVRQVAVDCLPEVSLAERSSLSSLNSDTDCTEAASEPVGRKCRRKRSQKFDYNKWYVYGDGTFRKLYGASSEKELDASVVKTQKSPATSLDQQRDDSQDIQISQERDLVADAPAAVSTTNTPLNTMQSALCTSTAVGQPPVDMQHTDGRPKAGVPSFVLLPGAMLKPAGLSPQQTDSRVIVGADIFSPKVTSGNSSFEIDPQHTSLPSERKKQRTEESISVAIDNMDAEMKEPCIPAYKIGRTDGDVTNGVNQSLEPAEREINRPRIQRQDRLIYPHVMPKELLQKRRSSPLLSVGRPSETQVPVASNTSTSITTTTTTTTATTNTFPPATTSFLPKYQLKLPPVLATDESNLCCRTAPLIRHSFSSSPIFTTCAPRSGHSESITSFTTLTHSQPVTPITLIHSQQQGRTNGGGPGLNASGLPVPGLTWGCPAVTVGALMQKSPAPTLAVPYPPRTLGNTNDTSRMTQNQMLTTVAPALPGQSYVCKTVLAQGQLGSITTPRHNQSVIPAMSDNQNTLAGKLYLQQHSKSLTNISGIGTPVIGQFQHAVTVTDADLGQSHNSLSTTVFSTGGVNKTATGVTLNQTSALPAVRCHIQQVSPVANLYQQTPATPTTVYAINQPVRGGPLNQTAGPATIQYHVQKAIPASDTRNGISAKQNTMFPTKQSAKPAGELLLSQPGTPVTMQYQMQQVIGLAQNVLVTPTTLLCPGQPVKNLANMSLKAVQHQAQESTAATQLHQEVPATPAKLVYNSQVGKPVREGPFSQTSSPLMVQYQLQQLTGLAQNPLASPVTVIGSQPIKQVTDMTLQQLSTPATVHVIQQATPIAALSQKSPPTPFTSSLSQTMNHITDLAVKQVGKPAGPHQHQIQQPTSVTAVCHTRLTTPVTAVPHHQPSTAVTSQHQQAIPSTGLDNNKTPVPANIMLISQPATPQAGVVENLQSSTATSAGVQGPPQAATAAPLQRLPQAATAAPVQGGVSIGTTVPPQPTTMPCPRSPSLCSQTGIAAEAGSATLTIPDPVPNGPQGANIVRLSTVPQSPSQDTFIMTTPDLQIVMQLISDEQLALIAPQIETGDCKPGAGCSVIAGSTQAAQMDVCINVLKTNNRSNDVHSTPGGPTLTTIMSTNGSVMAQPGWAASISTAKSPTPASVLINTNTSQTERFGQSQGPVVLDSSKRLCKVDEKGTEPGQFMDLGIRQKSGVGQGDCIPNRLALSEKSSRTEHGFMEAHILVHNQQSSAHFASATLQNPTMQSCISKVAGTYQHSSLSASQSSVKTEQTHLYTIPSVHQGGHLSAVSAGSGVSVERARATGVETRPPPISACHTSLPAAHHPSVSNLPPPSERKGSSRSVSQPGAAPCPPLDAHHTTATTRTNPHCCELDVLSKAQAPGAGGQLTQTISASTEISISKQALPQPLDGPLGVPLPQPPGSLQILGGPAVLSQPNGRSAVLGGVERNSLPASSASSLVGLVSASYAGHHKLSPRACASALQVNGTGSVTCPPVSQHEPLGPKDTREVCYHTPLSERPADDACSPGRTSGEPQQSQQAMGQTERDQPSTSGRMVEVSGAGGALDQDQSDTHNIGMERTSRHEKTSCSSSIKADKGPGDGNSCQSPHSLPLGLGAWERPRGVPDEHRCGANMEDGGQTNRNEHGRCPSTVQAGSSGGGGGLIACGATERMLSPQTNPTMKECNIRQEDTGNHDPIWTLVAPPPPPTSTPLPPPPPPLPPPQSHEGPGDLLNLNLQLDTDCSSSSTPPRPPSHPASGSSSLHTSSPSDQSRTRSQTTDHSHPQPLSAQHSGPPAHSASVNATRCYQETGEASVTSLETGPAPPPPPFPHHPPPPPGPLHGDPLLHSPPETANHLPAERRAHVVLGGEHSSSSNSSSSSSIGCLGNHSGEAACETWVSAQVQISATEGDHDNSPSTAPAPHRTLSRAAKARTDMVGSLSWSLRGARKCMEEEEDNSSSSDDEGKLVIEFESN